MVLRYLRMRYQFMLEIDNIEEQRKEIIRGQNRLRQLVCQLRQSEREIYMLSLARERGREERRQQLELDTTETKERLALASEDLDMRIRCYRETQMASSQRSSAVRGEDQVDLYRISLK